MDEALADRILRLTGCEPGDTYGRQGAPWIKKKIKSFNKSAAGANYLAMVDFRDTGLSCPAEVISQWVPHRTPSLIFRVVVNELESWLMADRKSLADFLKISIHKIPPNPEAIGEPKKALIQLARASRSARIKSALVPDLGSTAQVGKLYSSEMILFIQEKWNIERAASHAPSLERCLTRLQELKKSIFPDPN